MEGDETGGSCPRVFGDTEQRLWMVKAPNNPQNGQVLASEFVGAVIGSRLGAAIPPAAICELSDELVVGLTFPDGRAWASGEGFGSHLLPSAPPLFAVGTHEPVLNGAGLAAVVAVDTLLGSHNGRQARACPAPGGWSVWGVDFGHDIGPGAWNRSTLLGSPDPTRLEDPNGWLAHSSTEDWAEVADTLSGITDDDFTRIVGSIPLVWGPAAEDRSGLVAYLVRRREPVVTLIRQRIGAEEAKQ